MFEVVGFLAFLVATVVALGFTVASGLRRRRRRHRAMAILSTVLLAATVYFAFLLGEVRQFPAEELAFHKIFSRASALLLVPVVGTGIGLWFRPGWRWSHRICVAGFLIAVVMAAITGVWILWLSTALT